MNFPWQADAFAQHKLEAAHLARRQAELVPWRQAAAELARQAAAQSDASDYPTRRATPPRPSLSYAWSDDLDRWLFDPHSDEERELREFEAVFDAYRGAGVREYAEEILGRATARRELERLDDALLSDRGPGKPL